MTSYEFHFPSGQKLKGFEKVLAMDEIKVLSGSEPKEKDGVVYAESQKKIPDFFLKRLPYFSMTKKGEETIISIQTFLDASQDLNGRANLLSFDKIETLLDKKSEKRAHVYLSHGFHQYKGKYFPQLVTSILDITQVTPNQLVFDPFCGSGTTLVESKIHSIDSIGVDINPLAVFISNTKINAFELDEKNARSEVDKLKGDVWAGLRSMKVDDEYSDLQGYQTLISPGDSFEISALPNFEYLSRWFPEIILTKISVILSSLNSVSNKDAKDLCLVSLSNILREYSYQDHKQIRIKRKKEVKTSDFIKRYFQELDRNIGKVKLCSYFKTKFGMDSSGKAYCADILDKTRLESLFKEKPADSVITSPPYANALPYIDTDRLSLLLFDLMSVKTRKDIESALIGNREISRTVRDNLWEEYEDIGKSILPVEANDLITRIYEQNSSGKVGFRKENVPSLLFKYFKDMRFAFENIHSCMKVGAYFTVIIGNSSTNTAKGLVEIQTDRILEKTGVIVGFRHIKSYEMTNQLKYMVHSKNAISKETIIIFQKK